MKKFYTLALAVAVALSASAAEHKTAAKAQISLNPQLTVTAKPFDKAAGTSTVSKAPAKAAAIEDFTGDYDWSYTGMLTSDSGDKVAAVTITVTDAATGAVEISGLPQNFVIKGTIDLKANTLTIPNKQSLGKDAAGDMNFFYVKEFNAAGDDILDGASSAAATVGQIIDDAIVFPEIDVWAIGDPDHEELGWWKLTYANSFSVAKDPNEGWTAIGTGTFLENIIWGCFFEGDNKTTCQVELYTKEDEGKLLKILDPFQVLYKAAGFNAASPEMIIDMTDPENILVDLQSTGINGGEDGLYGYFSDSWYNEDASATEEALRIKAKVEGNTTTVTFPVKSMYLYAAGSNSIYYAATAVSTLTYQTTGINDVAVDAAQGEIEYFNLQGVRVANPENGIYIRRQGNNATKVFVK